MLPFWLVFSIGPLINLEDKMSYTMELYVSEYGMGKSSVAWNYIQSQHSTCGVFGALDWQDSQWAKHRECYIICVHNVYPRKNPFTTLRVNKIGLLISAREVDLLISPKMRRETDLRRVHGVPHNSDQKSRTFWAAGRSRLIWVAHCWCQTHLGCAIGVNRLALFLTVEVAAIICIMYSFREKRRHFIYMVFFSSSIEIFSSK